MTDLYKLLCKNVKESIILTNKFKDLLSDIKGIKFISEREKQVINDMQISNNVHNKILQNLHKKNCE